MKPEGYFSDPQAAFKSKQAQHMTGTAAEQAVIELSLHRVTQALVGLLPALETSAAANKTHGKN